MVKAFLFRINEKKKLVKRIRVRVRPLYAPEQKINYGEKIKT